MTSFHGEKDFVLIADTFAGLIWRVNIDSGSAQVALNDSTTAGSKASPTGVNGIKIFNNILYYTNTGLSSLFKVPILRNGTVSGCLTMVANNLPCDDFAFDTQGNAYVAGPANVITKVSPQGDQSVIAGTFNSTKSALVGSTAVAFGRLASDRTSIYVTTNGGAGQEINGTQGVSRVDVFAIPSLL